MFQVTTGKPSKALVARADQEREQALRQQMKEADAAAAARLATVAATETAAAEATRQKNLQRFTAAINRHKALEAMRVAAGEEKEESRQKRLDAAARRAAAEAQQKATLAFDHGLEVFNFSPRTIPIARRICNCNNWALLIQLCTRGSSTARFKIEVLSNMPVHCCFS